MKKMKFLLVSMLVMASAVFNVMSAKVIGVPTKGNAVLNPRDAQIVKVAESSNAHLTGNPLQFDFFGSGDKAVFDINNSMKKAFTISFEAASAIFGASVQMIVTDADGNEEMNQTISINRGGWADFGEYSINTPVLGKGKKKFTVVFLNKKGSGVTVNVRNIKFEK